MLANNVLLGYFQYREKNKKYIENNLKKMQISAII